MENKSGEAVYYNVVEKGGKLRFVIKAASGQVITGRDRQKLKKAGPLPRNTRRRHG